MVGVSINIIIFCCYLDSCMVEGLMSNGGQFINKRFFLQNRIAIKGSSEIAGLSVNGAHKGDA